jgi:nitroreductase
MAPLLDLTPDELLSTTRAVRKRLDLERPVPLEIVRECIELAVQAPSGSNRQGWQWVVVTDPAKRARIGELYARAFALYRQSPGYAGRSATGDAARDATQARVASSAEHLAAHMGDVPVLVIPCIVGRPQAGGDSTAGLWGSLLPAAWSFCLAARARGLGTAWTTLHLLYEREVAEVVGIPYDEVSQGVLLPLAYTVGTDFAPGPRVPLDDILHVDSW